MGRRKRRLFDDSVDDIPACGDVNAAGKVWCTCAKHCQGGSWQVRSTWYYHGRFRSNGTGVEASIDQVNRATTPSISENNPSWPGTPSQSIRLEPERHPSPGRGDGAGTPAASETDTGRSPLRNSLEQDYPRSPTPVRSLQRDNSQPLPPGSGSVDPGSLADLENDQDGEIEESENQADQPAPSRVSDLAIAQDFISRLKSASLENGDLTEEQLYDIRNPSEDDIDLDSQESRITRHCIRIFLSTRNGSNDSYSEIVASAREAHPDDAHLYLSLDQVKRRIAKLSGVFAVEKHMCPSACVAFTGPFERLDRCPECNAARFDSRGKPVQTFDTILLGPQVQALRRHPDRARAMRYFIERVRALLVLRGRDGFLSTFDDLTCGDAFLDAVESGALGETDTLLMASMDGAQLYRNKTSDCWIMMWSVLNFANSLRFKQGYLLPGAFIPGKPKNVDSFLFPGLYHVAAINNAGGLHVYDAARRITYQSLLRLLLAIADGVAAVHYSGLVPHHGKFGCRLFCELPGRHKPGRGGSHYYPALLKPDDYVMDGCDHDDVDISSGRAPDAVAYERKLAWLLESRTQTEYEFRRRETGISKPSILRGLADWTPFGVPLMCPGDAMHEILNLADLFITLLRGTIDCGATDSKTAWVWAVLKGDIWEIHGKDVAFCIPFLPGSYGRGPRNPAEKINSGYKAWEHLLYLFSLGPGLFLGVLPTALFRTYCKLVAGVRILYQKSITRAQLERAKKLLLEFTYEFELHFYQRRIDRLHFVRQSIHNLSHWAPETFRLGPSACYSQWTMERFIGLATADLRQHSTPYKNLSRRGLEKAQLNALKAMVPSLDRDAAKEAKLPRGSQPLDNGYVLLRALDTCERTISAPEYAALCAYLHGEDAPINEDWDRKIRRWSRLRLPNGQVARSLWKEQLKSWDRLRRARDVKLWLDATLEFAEVRYYFEFEVNGETKTLAMVSLCTRPDQELLELSSYTLWSCSHQGDAGLRVIEYSTITAVVAMPPHSSLLRDVYGDRVFVAEMPGLDIAEMGGPVEDIVDEPDE